MNSDRDTNSSPAGSWTGPLPAGAWLAFVLFPIWSAGCELLGQNEVYELSTGVNDSVLGTMTPSSRQFESGSRVTLEAKVRDLYRNGYRFGWWEGDLSADDNPHTFTIRGDTEVVAVFRRKEHTLEVRIEGEGSVEHRVADGSEGGVAEDNPDMDYQHGTRVQLEAFPEPGWQFCLWRGEDFTFNRTNNPTTDPPGHVGMWDDRLLTAIFKPAGESCSS